MLDMTELYKKQLRIIQLKASILLDRHKLDRARFDRTRLLILERIGRLEEEIARLQSEINRAVDGIPHVVELLDKEFCRLMEPVDAAKTTRDLVDARIYLSKVTYEPGEIDDFEDEEISYYEEEDLDD